MFSVLYCIPRIVPVRICHYCSPSFQPSFYRYKLLERHLLKSYNITPLFCLVNQSGSGRNVAGRNWVEDSLGRTVTLQTLEDQKLSYKERMHPKVSNAEIEVFKALSVQGLTGGMVTQQPIVLKSTVPDFCWLNKRKIVYLDGNQVHIKDKAQQRDAEIDELLEMQGWDVLRIPYDPPLTENSLREIMITIRKFLGANDDE